MKMILFDKLSRFLYINFNNLIFNLILLRMDNLTPLESYVLAQKDSFQAISSAIQSFSWTSQDEEACHFPSEAFVKALLEKENAKICQLLAKSTLRAYVFKVAIDTKNKAYIKKYFDKADFYLNGKQIIALFELGCKNIAEKFLGVSRFLLNNDYEFQEYLRSHNYKYSF